ncbi:sigma-70 family RNA polymerase sigma factor [Actinomadura opuntiae]|uniref:sigma-70 family RNA polymerase sigma factor n=1 Tax=Actinomadura sp. OS1-43 TaxID=604315 RepID=UPI00255A7573|nr:sigma-70 family RNA polymerase sigma factor [Actinomadura sp. OS1-43]MDL4815133.1 sigma-70 family RNA polymerase sigma factor [Actinomadura sp. OS1-43]
MGEDVDLLVRAAQDGDAEATERLVAAHLPLLYNVVGWALDGHADVDDVVQDSVLRALGGLDGLREPGRFRSWLVSIAMNQVRRRWSALQRGTPMDPEDLARVAASEADFAEAAVLRLELSGQRREIAEATRWLDAGERDLLGLWWLEASGHLSRAELADALGLPAAHAAVRVQRMKKQLATCRAVVRVVAAAPRCEALGPVLARWDGRPSPLWRKRVAKHIRGCRVCGARERDLLPPEALLAGLVMVPLPAAHPLHSFATALATGGSSGAGAASSTAASSTAASSTAASSTAASSTAASSGAGGAAKGGVAAASKWAAGAAVAGVAGAAVIFWGMGDSPDPPPRSADPPAVAQRTPSRTPEPHPGATSVREHLARPTKKPAKAPASTVEQQVVRLVNENRARAGCRPLRVSPALHKAAQAHAQDMASRRALDHRGAGGDDPGDRITAAGFRWSAWAENIAQGQTSPPAVVTAWMNSAGHRANILNCRLTMIGVGVVRGSGGPWWTQDFATPA